MTEDIINSSGADKIIFRQAATSLIDRVRVVTHRATIVGDQQLGMMILTVDHVSDRIDEGKRNVKIKEGKGLADLTLLQRPAVDCMQMTSYLVRI